MSLTNFLKRLFGKEQPHHSTSDEAMMRAPDPELAQKILGMLAITQEEELTCDEVFALLDQFTEMAVRGEDVSSMMPMVEQHLGICSDCREEYEALERIVAAAS